MEWSDVRFNTNRCGSPGKKKYKFSSGLKIIVQTCQRTFETGKKVTNQFLNNYTVTHDKILSNWNYRVTPNK
jgi:hypothetical protein